VYERLKPAGEPVAAIDILTEAAFGEHAPEGRPYVFFNFVSTLDGRAALYGSTRPLGGPADLEMLLSLRAVADAVLIGPGTIRAEGYGRLVGPQRRAEAPPAVLISRRFDIPSRRRSRSCGSRNARRRRRSPTCAPAGSGRC
jgi:riboflavin biosynthesis pyrimidine reductase